MMSERPSTQDQPTSDRIRLGPAGWSSPDGEGPVDPTPKPRGFAPLASLAQSFDTIEINSTCDRLPAATMTRGWATRVSDYPACRCPAQLWSGVVHEAQLSAEDRRPRA
jgi:hypothetical protein